MESATVIGAGLMGTGIARHLAESGLAVSMVDTDQAQLAKAETELEAHHVRTSTQLTDFADADFVIEAVFEDLEVKRELLQSVSNIVSPLCTIASNTSSLLISDLATNVTHPERFIGVHYNNPADFNPIVEVIPTNRTLTSLTEAMIEWMSAHNKRAVKCEDTHCFVLNRQSLPYINEAARCLDIASPGEIDHVATTKLGSGLGPFAVMNLVGLPVMAAASRNLAILGRGYEAAETLQTRASEGSPWQIDGVSEVDREKTSTLVKRLRGAMLFPGKDILDRALCSKEGLHMICIEALGYEKSSVELLEVLREHIVEQLISDYLHQF